MVWLPTDPIQNLDHLQTNLFLTIQNSDKSGILKVEPSLDFEWSDFKILTSQDHLIKIYK